MGYSVANLDHVFQDFPLVGRDMPIGLKLVELLGKPAHIAYTIV